MNPLVYWAVEREGLRKRKESGVPGPWSDDEILNTYRLTG